MKVTITKVRKSILDFIDNYKRERGYMPTVREIGASIGQNNPSVVQYHMEKLQAVGLLERTSFPRDIAVNLGAEIVVIDSGYVSGSGGKRKAKRIPVSKEIGMIEYFGGCAYCGELSDSYHRDHFAPFVLGGSDEAHNILLACPKCNLEKGAKEPVRWVIEKFGVDRLDKIVIYLHTR